MPVGVCLTHYEVIYAHTLNLNPFPVGVGLFHYLILVSIRCVARIINIIQYTNTTKYARFGNSETAILHVSVDPDHLQVYKSYVKCSVII